MKNFQQKIPSFKNAPPYRQPKIYNDPKSYDKEKPRIIFDLLDFEHNFWGWDHLTKEQHIEFLKFIHGIEKISWAELKETAGGKSKGTNHHSLEVENFSNKAKLRLKELNLQPIVGDTLFSFRLKSLTRIYGLREEIYFRPIWYDRYHNDREKAAYPCKRN